MDEVRLPRPRAFGDVFCGWALWRRLGLNSFWQERLDQGEGDVPGSKVAAILTVKRLCAPGGELSIERRGYPIWRPGNAQAKRGYSRDHRPDSQ